MPSIQRERVTILVGLALLLHLCLHWHIIILHTTTTSSYYYYYSSATSSSSSSNDSSTTENLHSLLTDSSAATIMMKGMTKEKEDEYQLLNNTHPLQNQQEQQSSKPYLRGNTTICATCYRSYSEDGSTSCYSKIIMQQQQRRKNNKSFSFMDAARMIDGICNLVCHPDNCHMYLYPKLVMAATTSVIADNTNNNSSSSNNNTNKVLSYYSKYWRYDTVGPTYTNPRTIYFSSIPKTKRIPPTRFHDIETYLSERYDEMLKPQQQPQQQQPQQQQHDIKLGLHIVMNSTVQATFAAKAKQSHWAVMFSTCSYVGG